MVSSGCALYKPLRSAFLIPFPHFSYDQNLAVPHLIMHAFEKCFKSSSEWMILNKTGSEGTVRLFSIWEINP
jgi:hypothetical protein